MQVNIGGKIKELRKRDGRKQEDLANALGVTSQAVSRWESNGCFPDINLIPSIANYFHVSIDSLFGYDNDRDIRIKEYRTRFNRFFIENDAESTDLNNYILNIKNCLNEFPGDPELRRLLAFALTSEGKKQEEKPNIYLSEAAELLEGLLSENVRVIEPLLYNYIIMGQYEKAIEKASMQPKLDESREMLLAFIDDFAYEQKNNNISGKYHGEAVLSLLHELSLKLPNAVLKNEKTKDTDEGLGIISALKDLYKAVFNGNDYGKFHSDMCLLELDCASIYSKTGNQKAALSSFETAFEHYVSCEKIFSESGIKESYTAHILEKVEDTSIPIPVIRKEFFLKLLETFPEEMKNDITSNQKFKVLFE